MKKRILIVEDHNLLRQGLRSLVSTMPDFEVAGEARDGKEAIHQAQLLKPDLVLMDLSMPGMNGMEAAAQIKRRMPDVRIIALTAFKTDEYVREALRSGADGYVLKDASYEELVMALRRVSAGKRFLSADVSGRLVDTLLNSSAGGRPAAACGPWDKLTARERSILKLIAEGRTNRSAAEFLNVSPKTVEKHRASVMHKLGLKNVAELTLAALESGLIERPGSLGRLFGGSEEADGGSGESAMRSSDPPRVAAPTSLSG